MGEPVAFVTGVSRGLGAALAASLVARGFDVVGIGRSAPDTLASPRFGLLSCDLARLADLPAVVGPMFDRYARERPQRSVLINNAATAAPVGYLAAADFGEIATAFAVNLSAPAILADLFCRKFVAPLKRRVINVSSGAAVMALAGCSAYCAAKSGLESLTRTLAAEISDPGFRAIAIRPGIVDTPMQAFLRSQSEDRLPVVEKFIQFHAGGQLAPAETVAAAIVDRLVLGAVEHGRIYNIADL